MTEAVDGVNSPIIHNTDLYTNTRDLNTNTDPMILIVVSSLILMKRRWMVEVVPTPLKKLWKKWELRAMVVLSLTSQIVQVILGNRRKYNHKIWIKCVVWSAYLLADSVATMSLGILLNDLGETFENDHAGHPDANNELTTFWAPFFLLHLGGQDTITAYSLEDNELYLRHIFNLGAQTVAAVYIFLTAWDGSYLSFLTIPMIFVGSIKYGERIWTLWSVSSDQLRDSMLTSPDPGPNYPKFMNEYSLKEAEGFKVVAEEVKDTAQVLDKDHVPGESFTSDDNNISKAHYLFQKFKCLFADLILSLQDRDISQPLFQKMSYEDAFNVVAIELGFMYDLLYTKAAIVYTYWGIALRILTTSLTFLVLVIFIFFVYDQQKYDLVHLYVTFMLLSVAIVLEIYAAFVLIFSDQSRQWFNKNQKTFILIKAIACLEPVFKLPRWSNSMAQYSLTSLFLDEKSGPKILKLLPMNKLWEEHRYKTHKQVPEHLKKLIFKHVMKKCDQSEGPERGSHALDKYHKLQSLGWSVTAEVGFDQSILIWHIATELCYYSWDNNPYDINRKMSKFLSRYMLYLLVIYPFLLPVGIGLIRVRDTCSEAINFFKERKSVFENQPAHATEASDKKRERRVEACRMLLAVKTNVRPIKVKGDRSKSVLFDACRVASELNEISDTKQRWKMVRDVWLEILTYAASTGRGSQHARQLKRGGELITHVWLLMAHFGKTEQFQISQGNARARLVVE